MKYLDGNEFLKHDEGGRIFVIKGRTRNFRIHLEEIYKFTMLHFER
jgi:hypothetical protein